MKYLKWEVHERCSIHIPSFLPFSCSCLLPNSLVFILSGIHLLNQMGLQPNFFWDWGWALCVWFLELIWIPEVLWFSNEVKFRCSEECLTLNLIISNLLVIRGKKMEYLAINLITQIKNLFRLTWTIYFLMDVVLLKYSFGAPELLFPFG